MSKVAAELLDAHRDELLRFIHHRIGCPDTALDILQDCFIRFSAYLETNSVQNPRAFLYKMAANQATDHLRQHIRRNEQESDLNELPELVDPAPLPEDIVAGKQRLELLKQALSSLPAKHREVFVLRNIKHLSFAEITDITGLSYNTIFKYLNEALLHCQKRMQD
jgi:RNA polymerase sigma factor (sigma-70 family)